MPIEEDLRNKLGDALRAHDARTADVIRMIISKVMERRNAKGFTGPVDDALHVDVIAVYRKSLVKAREEFLAAGERGQTGAKELEFEIAYCDRFLPKGLSAEELAAAVRDAIVATGAKDAKMAGRVVGEVMKAHKGKVEAGEVKKAVEAALPKSV